MEAGIHSARKALALMQQVQQGAPLSEALDPTSAVSSSVCRGNNSLGSGQPVGRENERTSQRVPFNAAPKVSPTRGRTEYRAKRNRKRKRSRTERREKSSARQLKRAAARKRREKIQRVFYVHRQLKAKARREKEQKEGRRRIAEKKKRVKLGRGM